jgi:hypothetical protein
MAEALPNGHRRNRCGEEVLEISSLDDWICSATEEQELQK